MWEGDSLVGRVLRGRVSSLLSLYGRSKAEMRVVESHAMRGDTLSLNRTEAQDGIG